MLRLAASIVSRRNCSGGPSGRSRSKASAAAFEATSPAWAPPIPSATTKIGARTKKESSLALRWRPVSVRKAWSSIRSIAYACASNLNSVSPMRTTSPSSSSASPVQVASLSRVPLVEFMSST